MRIWFKHTCRLLTLDANKDASRDFEELVPWLALLIVFAIVAICGYIFSWIIWVIFLPFFLCLYFNAVNNLDDFIDDYDFESLSEDEAIIDEESINPSETATIQPNQIVEIEDSPIAVADNYHSFVFGNIFAYFSLSFPEKKFFLDACNVEHTGTIQVKIQHKDISITITDGQRSYSFNFCDHNICEQDYLIIMQLFRRSPFNNFVITMENSPVQVSGE